MAKQQERVLGHGAEGDIDNPGEFAPEETGKTTKKKSASADTKSQEDK